MSNSRKKHSAKGRCKKSPAAQQQYRNFIAHSSYSPDGTSASSINPYLIGSDYADVCSGEIEASTDPVAALPFSIKLKKFFRKNTVQTIITVVILPFCVWIVVSIFNTKTEIAVLSERVTSLRSCVDTMSTDTYTKEMINMQLDSVGNELELALFPKLDSIEDRLDLIEKELNSN